MNSIKAFHQHLVNSIRPTYGDGEAKSIARIIFEDAFRIFDFSSEQPFLFQQSFETIQHRLLQNEPVQYVLGQADFYGLKLKVTPDVLIPRSETEELVYWILATNSLDTPSILDIGTGSGCIPIVLKKRLPNAMVDALDKSEVALDIAKENAQLNKVVISFFLFDILQKDNWSQLPVYDIIVSNPPYIPTKEMPWVPAWVKQFEPEIALFVTDEDPLLFYRTIAEFALHHLKPNGQLFFETNEFNAASVVDLLATKGFNETIIKKDLANKDRLVSAKINT